MDRGTDDDADARSMLDPRSLPALADLARDPGLDDADLDEITELFVALRRWHWAAEAHGAAVQRRMRLGKTDMRALRYLMALERRGSVVTPTMLADHLGIALPSVTKLLDRLEQAGHIRRSPHPHDRRALSITVTESTSATASARVGGDHARRFEVAARMTSNERRAATAFLAALAELPVIDDEADPRHT